MTIIGFKKKRQTGVSKTSGAPEKRSGAAAPAPRPQMEQRSRSTEMEQRLNRTLQVSQALRPPLHVIYFRTLGI